MGNASDGCCLPRISRMFCADAFIASKRRFTCEATILDISPGVRYLASVPAACCHREAPERDVTRSVTEDLDLRRVLWQFDCVQHVDDNGELTKYTSARFITQRSHTIHHKHVDTLSTVFSSHTNLAMAMCYALCRRVYIFLDALSILRLWRFSGLKENPSLSLAWTCPTTLVPVPVFSAT